MWIFSKKYMDKLPNYVQVGSPLEFTRLVCALERMPRVSFLHEHKGKKVFLFRWIYLKKNQLFITHQ